MIKEGPPEKAFLDAMEKYGVKDWSNPLHYYDYQSAWKEGASQMKQVIGLPNSNILCIQIGIYKKMVYG